MQNRYTFPAFFCYEEGINGVGVVFPDLPGCVSQGDDDEDALHMAKEAMTLHLWGMEEDDDEIPAPTPLKDLDDSEYREPNVKLVPVLIDAFMPPFRERMNNKAVTKTVTVPRWLEMEAKTANLNYSQVLQDGLMERLGIRRKITRRQKGKGSPAGQKSGA